MTTPRTARTGHRVGPKGQVVLPKELRDEFGIEPGTHVAFDRREDGVLVRKVGAGTALRGRFAAGADLLADLAAEKRDERSREDARGR